MKSYLFRSLPVVMALVMSHLFYSEKLSGQTVVTTYNSSGTFTVPAGITQVTVKCWGGGGRGGRRNGSNLPGEGGGGGGGGFSCKLVTVVPGNTYTVHVGLGGNNGGSPNGDDSYFDNATLILARGGTGVPDNSNLGGAGGASGIGDITYTGGNGANAPVGSAGGGGSSAGTGAGGNNATGNTGATAPAGGGNGGAGGSGSGNAQGIDGSAPGGGGGGAHKTSLNGSVNGGFGAAGKVIVSYTICPAIAAVLSGDALICSGESTDLSVSISDGTSPYTVVYSGGTVTGYTSGSAIPVSPVSTTVYTLTSVTDANGCTATVSGTATVTIDDVAPVIDPAPSDVTVECDGSGNTDAFDDWLSSNGGAEASDAGVGGVSWSNDFSSFNYTCGASGSVTVTFFAADECGNSSSAAATFTIEDTTAPSIEIEASGSTVECDGSGNETELTAWLDSNGGASASDACGDVTWSNDYTGLSDDCGATGSATVTFTATDACGNTSQTVASFTIEDTTPPAMDTEASGTTVECDGAGNATELAAWLDANGGASASDACGDVTWSNNYESLSDDCGATGSATVTFTATDDCGNTSETVATFTIEDTTPPDAVCQNITIEWDEAGNASFEAADIDGGSNDVCGGVTLSVSQEDFNCANLGANEVTLTVTDDCGNSSTCTAIVTVAIPEYAICGHDLDKVLICHYPPGFPENLETICINPISLCDHLGHGDHLGVCESARELSKITAHNADVSTDQSHGTSAKTSDVNNGENYVITNLPNPFNNETQIGFELAKPENVSLKVFNNTGELVAVLQEGILERGVHSFNFAVNNLPEGFYFYTFTAGNVIQSGRMILQR
jgi:hypothetical protein